MSGPIESATVSRTVKENTGELRSVRPEWRMSCQKGCSVKGSRMFAPSTRVPNTPYREPPDFVTCDTTSALKTLGRQIANKVLNNAFATHPGFNV